MQDYSGDLLSSAEIMLPVLGLQQLWRVFICPLSCDPDFFAMLKGAEKSQDSLSVLWGKGIETSSNHKFFFLKCVDVLTSYDEVY